MTPLLALAVAAALSNPAALPPPAGAPVPLVVQAERQFEQARRQFGPAATELGRAPRETLAARGDSLKNGAVIGAITGALGFGGFIGYLCTALNDTKDAGNCVKAALVAAGAGALGGAAIGAGVDALFDRPMAVVRVRF